MPLCIGKLLLIWYLVIMPASLKPEADPRGPQRLFGPYETQQACEADFPPGMETWGTQHGIKLVCDSVRCQQPQSEK
jgi:hypothetical protein